MRLINTRTLKLEEFEYPEVPPYAILSHTWTKNEVLYEDLSIPHRLPGKDAGYAKVDNTSKKALEAGIGYCWIDTCCIDKKNQAELSEAINSMYNWYKEADICYVYLADVTSEQQQLCTKNPPFARSRWFMRGWTLQELLAPANVQLLSSEWDLIGSKTDLAPTISAVTRIPVAYLKGADLDKASVAQRMSWVSKRATTKAEDKVYCLLGIFDIHMPLLYGEREPAAFKRLQYEIMKDCSDTSIFAWACDVDHDSRKSAPRKPPAEEPFGGIPTYGLLARSPQCFANSGDIRVMHPPKARDHRKGLRTASVIDNKGLHLCLPLLEYREPAYQLVLACGWPPDMYATIDLRDISTNGGRYVRVNASQLATILGETVERTCTYQDVTTETRAFNRIFKMDSSSHIASARQSMTDRPHRLSLLDYPSNKRISWYRAQREGREGISDW